MVVRWFGGTLLGSGGLVSAYSDAARAALDQARSAFVTRSRQRLFTLEAPPALSGQWENELRRRGARIAGWSTPRRALPSSACRPWMRAPPLISSPLMRRP
ncbi:YigZ family protein [Nesterenkonia pannonica]|uniref:YigZ family protein n=1 Tax=Nesterenkonia pannonica TaxID=1548602 RepID=UPI00216411E1|nr:YigZ family protein [Nesterenkonia pannonica]